MIHEHMHSTSWHAHRTTWWIDMVDCCIGVASSRRRNHPFEPTKIANEKSKDILICRWSSIRVFLDIGVGETAYSRSRYDRWTKIYVDWREIKRKMPAWTRVPVLNTPSDAFGRLLTGSMVWSDYHKTYSINITLSRMCVEPLAEVLNQYLQEGVVIFGSILWIDTPANGYSQ